MASGGYTSFTINDYLSSAVHFGGWVEGSGLNFGDIHEETIQALGATSLPMSWTTQPETRFPTPYGTSWALRSVSAATRCYRSDCGLDDEAPPSLDAFRGWLLRHQGLALVTVERHERLITRMLPTLGMRIQCSLSAPGPSGSDTRLSAGPMQKRL
jgi:hypothetical protein